MAQLTDNHALLIYRVGPVLCCAPTHPVETLIQPPSLTHPPGSSDSHPGIFRHDGKLVSLIEVRQLFGVVKQDRKQPGRVIICRLKDRHTGFLVDEIIDVIDTPASGWGQLSPSLSGGVFNRSLLLNDRIHLYTEFEKLQKVRNKGFLKAWIEQFQEKPPPQKTAITGVNRASVRPETVKEEPSPASPPLSSTPSRTGLAAGDQQLKAPPIRTDTTGAATGADSITLEPSQPPHSQPDQPQQGNNPDHFQSGTQKRSPVRKNSMPKTARLNENRQQNSPVNKKAQTATAATAIEPAVPISSPQASPPRAPGFTQIKPNLSSLPQRPDPAADTRNTTAMRRSENKKQAGTGLFPAAVLLICAGLIATLVYLWPDHSTKPSRIAATRTPAVTAQPQEPVAGKLYVSSQDGPSPSPDKAAKEKRDAIPEEIKDENKAPATHDSSDNEDRYHATIKQQTKEHGAREVTIIITAPASDEVIRTEATRHETYKQSAETRSSPAAAGLPADKHEGGQQKPAAAQRIDEVVHIVVRGDTLWHIARRYIHNPFRYPELARLNKIRNPDLIYPGDRVRIVRIYQQPASASAD